MIPATHSVTLHLIMQRARGRAGQPGEQCCVVYSVVVLCSVVMLCCCGVVASPPPCAQLSPLSCSPDLCPASSCKAPSSSKVRTNTTTNSSIATAVLSSSPQQQCCVLHHHSIATPPTPQLLWLWSGLMLRDKTPPDCLGLGWPNTAVGSVFSHPHPAANSQQHRYYCHL